MILDLFFSFFKIGAFSFGGGYAMIPLMQKEIVERHNYLSLHQFGDIIAIAEMTPGPISVNCATFVGYTVAGLQGAVISTFGVMLPSVMVVLVLASVFINFQDDIRVRSIFLGIRPVVVALIVSAAYVLGTIGMRDARSVSIGVGVFAIMRYRKIHPVLVVVMAGCLGVVLYGFL